MAAAWRRVPWGSSTMTNPAKCHFATAGADWRLLIGFTLRRKTHGISRGTPRGYKTTSCQRRDIEEMHSFLDRDRGLPPGRPAHAEAEERPNPRSAFYRAPGGWPPASSTTCTWSRTRHAQAARGNGRCSACPWEVNPSRHHHADRRSMVRRICLPPGKRCEIRPPGRARHDAQPPFYSTASNG